MSNKKVQFYFLSALSFLFIFPAFLFSSFLVPYFFHILVALVIIGLVMMVLGLLEHQSNDSSVPSPSVSPKVLTPVGFIILVSTYFGVGKFIVTDPSSLYLLNTAWYIVGTLIFLSGLAGLVTRGVSRWSKKNNSDRLIG